MDTDIQERTEAFSVAQFENEDLNELTAIIYALDEEYSEQMRLVREHVKSAFHKKWKLGEELWRYENIIFDHFDTWKDFAEAIGKNPSQISRAFNGFQYLKDEGAEEWDDVVELLEKREIRLTAKNFERIGRLLNEPEGPDYDVEEQESKDMKRLQELQAEAEEILTRNENANRNEPIQDQIVEAEGTLNYVEEIVDKIKRQDPYNVEFESETYLDFIRNYGRDLISGKPCEKCDPHHTDPYGGTGNYADKLPDWTCIPVSRETHDLLTKGELNVSPEAIMKAQIKCLATFLISLA